MKADKVLMVVEDSESLRKVLAEKLSAEGFEVLQASGGEDGIKIAQEQKPDLIITDIVMFPVDGLQMAKTIRESGDWGANVQIIALTNQSNEEESGRVGPLNLAAYLVKAETGLDEVVSHVKEKLKARKK